MTNNAWEHRIIYQIYPRSFKDSNHDGIGDLNGIAQELDYLKNLGIDAIWLSPVYRSPMRDFGYDISDYYDIDPIFGTLSDFDNLIAKVHEKGMKLLMDFVPNHTSSEHPWFKSSRSSKKDSKRDWYIWQPPNKHGGPPNNWLSQFGGSAWKLDKKTGEYYLHTFDVGQPDLNWRNPHVVEAVLRVMRFWMKRGVDGFRVDVAYYLFKDPFFRDEPINPVYTPERLEYDSLLHIYTLALPETLNMLKKLNSVVNEYEDRFMVCEIYTFPTELVNLYKIVDHRSFAPFNFSFISLPWDAQDQKKFIDEFDEHVGRDYFPTYVLGNHDQPRIATRLGPEAAKTAALLQLTLRGIPFIYYGEELGMQNVALPAEKVKDPMAVNANDKSLSRDPERTPMQWTDAEFGGFSDTEPWLPLEPNYKVKNVAAESKANNSFLNLYKLLIKLRKKRKSLVQGRYIALTLENKNILAFMREEGSEQTLIFANFSKDKQSAILPKGSWKTILSTNQDVVDRIEDSSVLLRSSEAIILTS